MATNGVFGVFADQVEEVGGHGGGEFGSGEKETGALFFSEGEVFFELREGFEGFAKLPGWVVPVGRVNLGKTARGRGTEFDLSLVNRVRGHVFSLRSLGCGAIMSKWSVCNGVWFRY